MCESVGQADLLSDHFDSKQSRKAVDLPSLAIHLLVLPPLPSGQRQRLEPFWCSRLLLDLNPYGGTDPLGMFPIFLKRTADVMAPVLV